MEKKKLLLVAVSVGVVLLIILIIPLLIISPRKDFESSWQEQSAVIEPPNLTQGWDNADVAEQQPGNARPVETRVDEITNIPAAPANTSRAAAASNVTTITIPAPRSVAVPDTPVGTARQAIRPSPLQSAASLSSNDTKQPVAEKPAAEKPAAAKPAAVASKTTAKTHDNSDFWIQTGAFSTMKYAEGAKDYLEARGIKSIIEDPVINGKTWYRVRVGPYTTRDEANYWLALVKSIDGFAASQVWETDAR
jgi:DedD protein